MAVSEEELQALAEEELAVACSLSPAEMARIAPWGDSHEGFASCGAEVEFERRYLWADTPRAVLVEVEVRAEGNGAEARRIVPT